MNVPFRAPAFFSIASLFFVVGCATATQPDTGQTDAVTTHDTSFADAGGDTSIGDTSVGDTPVETGCFAPKKVCGGKCVDVMTDNHNCGTCGNMCSDAGACAGGTCACGKDEVSCPTETGTECANLLSNANHCGDCSTKCGLDASGTPKICKDALCTPDCSKKTDCGGATCVDLKTDDLNCGACGKVCPTGQKCAAGACVACPTTGTICGPKCVDTSSDPANCGGCGTVCPTGETCTKATCVCPAGLTDCSGVCKDLTSDGSSCGKCGNVCGTGLFCNAGTCSSTCPTGRSGCGGSCIDTTSDPLNCGGCGKTCGGTTPYCSGGACVAIPKCNSGTLNVLFYGPIGAHELAYVPAGATTKTADSATWKAMTTADFAKYQLIVIGEQGGLSSTTPWDDAFSTKGTWGPAITGHIVVSTFDPVAHSTTVGATTYIKAALQWAATGPGTGLYVGPDYGTRKYDFLSTFGAWTELGQTAPDNYAGDTVHVVLGSHPTMTGSTDTSLSSWSYTFHGGLKSIPSTFTTVAQGTALASGTSTTTTVVAVRDAPCAP